MKIKIIILFYMLTSLAYSQEKGSLFLNVFPKDAIIRMNDTLLKSQETYLLDTGNYSLKMWLPTREYVERTVNVHENKTTQLLEVLAFSDDYKKYKGKKTLYNIEKTFMRYIPPIALGYIVFKTVSINNKISEERDLADKAKSNYENAFDKGQLETYKNEYAAHKSAYDENIEKYNKSMIIGGVVLVTTAALQYLSFKLKKPEYQEKVLLSSFGVGSYNNQLVPSYSLTYKF